VLRQGESAPGTARRRLWKAMVSVPFPSSSTAAQSDAATVAMWEEYHDPKRAIPGGSQRIRCLQQVGGCLEQIIPCLEQVFQCLVQIRQAKTMSKTFFNLSLPARRDLTTKYRKHTKTGPTGADKS